MTDNIFLISKMKAIQVQTILKSIDEYEETACLFTLKISIFA